MSDTPVFGKVPEKKQKEKKAPPVLHQSEVLPEIKAEIEIISDIVPPYFGTLRSGEQGALVCEIQNIAHSVVDLGLQNGPSFGHKYVLVPTNCLKKIDTKLQP
jgi:hypothetical protein